MKEFYYVSIDMAATGRKIKELRKARQLTVEQLSEYFDTSPQAIYKWQSGKTLPTLDNMMVLGRIFQIRIEDIVILEDDKSSFHIYKDGAA
ncbi:MAG TPA: helix-turn-helix transcriptional regulator [Lachnospiraceae bacterium]|nr:helix-turn-helix transcriptional regulator [Lachnospiraceae bacterium]